MSCLHIYILEVWNLVEVINILWRWAKCDRTELRIKSIGPPGHRVCLSHLQAGQPSQTQYKSGVCPRRLGFVSQDIPLFMNEVFCPFIPEKL
jgi:hypothetical protein